MVIYSSSKLFYHFQIFVDPFEEMGMGARYAEQHRRSASENEVKTCCYLLVDAQSCVCFVLLPLSIPRGIENIDYIPEIFSG